MSKLTIALLFAAVATLSMAVAVAPSSAQAGTLQTVQQYPPEGNHVENPPIFSSDYGWLRSDGSNANQSSGAATTGRAATGTLHNLDDSGVPPASDVWQGSTTSSALGAKTANWGDKLNMGDLDGEGLPRPNNGMYP